MKKGTRPKHVFVIDIGGTNTVVGIGTVTGKIKIKKKIKTIPDSGPAFLFTRINKILDLQLKHLNLTQKDILFGSIGSPGPLNLKKGTIIYSVNLNGWDKFNLVDPINSKFKVPAYIENDANLAGLGESWLGPGKGKGVVLCFTLGTGVGGAIIINDKIFNGSKGYGAELGHITINENGPQCTCSNRGCLEEYVSARGIVRRVTEDHEKFRKSKLFKYNPCDLTPHKICLAAKAGDKYAQFILRETGRYLGIGLASYTNIFNPDIIILGGGIMTENKMVLNAARKELMARAFKVMAKDVKLCISKLGDNANLIGAIKNGLNHYEGNAKI